MDDRLRDGTPVRIRPLRPEDAPEVLEGFQHLSFETRHRRYLAGLPRLPPQHVYAMTHADGVRHLVYGIAVLVGEGAREHGIGVAHVIRDDKDPRTGEFAIVIADDWQRRGAGLALTRAIARRSREVGIVRWTATMFADNVGVQKLLRRVATPRSRHVLGSGVVEVRYELRPVSRALAAP